LIEYPDVPHYLKHNLVLSLKDGCLLYESLRNNKNVLYNIPFRYIDFSKGDLSVHNGHFVKSDEGELPMHIKQFLTHYCNGISLTTTLAIDMIHYFLSDKEYVSE
jgi:hypothetical protein